MAYGKIDIISTINDETAYRGKVGVKQYLGLNKGINVYGTNRECVLSVLISRGEDVQEFCEGCKEDDCKYGLGLEGKIV